MPFKIHVFVALAITATICLIWYMAYSPSPPKPALAVAVAPADLRIAVISAAWPPSCHMRDEAPVIRAIADACNGKERCLFPIARDLFKPDAPTCALASLRVEYRCFSYDRPWSAQASNGKLTLDCAAHRKETEHKP